MLTKIQLLLLGIIAERPLNPYEMIKFLGDINANHWLKYADSTVYASIGSLENKNLITGEEIRDSKMPMRTVYTITSQGRENLHESLKQIISGECSDHRMFTIAIVFICHLEKECALELLMQKRNHLRKAIASINDYISLIENDSRMNPMVVTNVRSSFYIANANLTTVSELISNVESCHDWNYYLTNDLA